MSDGVAEEADARQRIDDHVKYLSNVIKESQAEYSRQLLSLSAAALGLSAAFYKNLSSPGSATWFPALYLAWLSFSLTIVTTLFAIQLSVISHKVYRDDLRKRRDDVNYVIADGGWTDKLMPWLVLFSSAAFVSGVTLIFLFTGHNIQRERSMSSQFHPSHEPKLPSDTAQIPIRDHVEVDRIPLPPSRPSELPKTPPAQPTPADHLSRISDGS